MRFCPLQEYADKVRRAMKEDALGERLQIEFNSELVGGYYLELLPHLDLIRSIGDPLGTMRYGKVKFDEDMISTKVSYRVR